MHRYKRGAPGLMQEPDGYVGLGTRQGGSTKVSESDPARAPEWPGWGAHGPPHTDGCFPLTAGCPAGHVFTVRPGEQILKGARVLVSLNCCCFVSHMLAREQEF